MKKIVIVILTLLCLFFVVYLYKQQKVDVAINESKVNLTQNKTSPTSSKLDRGTNTDVVNSDSPIQQSALEENAYDVDDLNDTVRPERVLDYISSFNGLFGDPKKIKNGDGVFVSSYYKKKGYDKDFLSIPIFEDNKVVSLVIYEQFNDSEEFLVSSVTDTRGYNWSKYPPLSRIEAKKIINKKYKDLQPYGKTTDYLHTGSEEPLYAFKSKEVNGIITVGSHNGYVTEITSKIPIPPEQQGTAEKTLNIQRDEDGYVSFSKEQALELGMSDKEIRKSELTAEITNYLIDEGVMTFDSSGEVDEDNRTPEIREQFNEVMDEFDKSDGEKTDLLEKYFN